MNFLDLVGLTKLMKLSKGNQQIVIGLIDGDVKINHPDLIGTNIKNISKQMNEVSSQSEDVSQVHGTFVAGILSGKRGSVAPSICPDCTLLVRPIFTKTISTSERDYLLRTSCEELATAIIEVIEKGSHVVNLSVELVQYSPKGEYKLKESLDYAARKGVFIIAAAGNKGKLGGSIITCHPWVIPVAACDGEGKLLEESNIGSSIGKRGLMAPGDGVMSIRVSDKVSGFRGTSIAAPFVTGTIALLLSEFPNAKGYLINNIVRQPQTMRRRTVIPPLLDAWEAYQTLARS